MEEAAWARSWGQEEPQTALHQETPALGDRRDTRVALGLPARPSRKGSCVSLCAFSVRRPVKGPAAPGSSSHNSQVVGGGGSGRRGVVSRNSTTASVPPEGWGSFSGNTCGAAGGWVSCWYRGSGRVQQSPLTRAPVVLRTTRGTLSVLKKWSVVVTVINK